MEFTENGAVVRPNDASEITPREAAPSDKEYAAGPRSALGLFAIMRIGLLAYIVAEILWLGVLGGYLLVPNYLPNFMFNTPGNDLNFILIAGTLYAVTTVVAFFFAARFTYRAMRNLHTIQSSIAEISPFWSVGYYFIPFANLVMPANAMSQIYHGTFQAVGEKSRHASPIPLWWASWLLQGVPGAIPDNTEMMGLSAFSFYFVSSALGIIAATMLIRMGDRISQRQELFKHGGVAHVFD